VPRKEGRGGWAHLSTKRLPSNIECIHLHKARLLKNAPIRQAWSGGEVRIFHGNGVGCRRLRAGPWCFLPASPTCFRRDLSPKHHLSKAMLLGAVLAGIAIFAACASAGEEGKLATIRRQQRNATSTWPYGPLRTRGRDIVNSRGEVITLAGVSWPLSGKSNSLRRESRPLTSSSLGHRRDNDPGRPRIYFGRRHPRTSGKRRLQLHPNVSIHSSYATPEKLTAQALRDPDDRSNSRTQRQRRLPRTSPHHLHGRCQRHTHYRRNPCQQPHLDTIYPALQDLDGHCPLGGSQEHSHPPRCQGWKGRGLLFTR
jgi:hypothetical protein